MLVYKEICWKVKEYQKTIKELFKQVNSSSQLEQEIHINYQNDCQNEIQIKYQNEPRFNGVYSSNNVSKIKDETYVINLDEYKPIGTHWKTWYINDDKS